MELIKKLEPLYILRFNYGEEFRYEIEKFCTENNIEAAWLNAIGATKEVEVGVYNLEKKQYDTKVFSEMLEITSIIGNVSMKDGRPFLHAHGTFGRPNMEIIGGHVMRCVVSATCEVALNKLEVGIGRKHDEFTGLYLICS